jgi:uncharacterized membrane protein
MIVGACLFAAALIASSYFLKGSPTGDWVDAFLYLGLACFLLSQVYFAIRGPKKHSE